ncbi:MAG: flagellar filament capping protein FliD [Defluviitaleaceae bacterium]|nr:flagellar filament capping protein FliD [Defluviitaleaceae bacterium]MCL2263122.1 flagellar filament capping protein FliD [Defluviitaleaceae bacterium]
MNSSPIRFTGLTSGMDTQTMVQQLMRAEGLRMQRLTSRRQVLQWRQENIRSSMTHMNEFRSARTDHIGAGAISNEATWNTMRTTVSGRNGADAPAGVSVASTNAAQPGSFDLTILQTAQGDTVRGDRTFNGRTSAEMNATRMGTFGFSGYETVQINGVNIRVSSEDTVASFLSRVNNSDANVNMRFNSMRNTFEIEHRGTGENAQVRTGGGAILTSMGLDNIRPPVAPDAILQTSNIWDVAGRARTGGNITIDGHDIYVGANATVQEFMTTVNDALEAAGSSTRVSFGSNASNAATFGRLSLTSSASDSAASTMTTGIQPLLQGLGLSGRNVAIPEGESRSVTGNTILQTTAEFTRNNGNIWELAGLDPNGGGYISIGDDSVAPIFIAADTTVAQFVSQVNSALQAMDGNMMIAFGSHPANSETYGRLHLTGVATASTGPVNMRSGNQELLMNLGIGGVDIMLTEGSDHRRVGASIVPNAPGSGEPDDGTRDRFVSYARNAIALYDGDVEISQASNTFLVHGVNVTVNANTTIPDDGLEITVNSERDTDATIAVIREFIEAYNDLVRHINSLHSTARPRAGNRTNGAFFEPLTDEQRQGMSDREVERWEEQARTGLLHRDRDMRNLHDQMRRAMFSSVNLGDGRSISLHEIGITSVGRDGAPGDQMIGVLQIDEARLRQVLEGENGGDVEMLFRRNSVHAGNEFARSSTIDQRNNRAPQMGLGIRLDDLLRTFADDDDGPLRQRAGYTRGVMVSENTMSRQIRDYNRRIAQMETFLQRRESHFFAMFARMETAMQQSHAQMDALFAFGMQ